MPALHEITKGKFPRVAILLVEWGLFILLCLASILFLHNRFGLAWDDGLQAFLGKHSLDFYLTLGKDRAFLDLHNMALYGSIFETASALVHRVLGVDDIFAYRGLLCGLAAMAAALATVRLASISGLGRLGWFAGLFLLTSPQFFGQAFINSKDIPFAAAYGVWWLCYIIWAKAGFRLDFRLLLTALSLGLVLGIRIAAVPLVGFTVCAGIGGWILFSRSKGCSLRETIFGFPWKSHLFVLLIGWGCMTLIWPLALLNPIVNPYKAFMTFISFPWEIDVFFAGEHFSSHALPRVAFFVEQLLSHPLWCYPLYILGLCSLVERWQSGDPFQRFICLALVFWILPLFIIFLASPFSLYNGVRQSLFLWPAYAWLGAMGLQFLVKLLKSLKISSVWNSLAGGAVLFANLVILISLHPFSYTYRNPTVRIFAEGGNSFNTDYHAMSYRLAAEWMDGLTLARHAQNRSTPTVLVWAPRYATLSYSYFVRTDQDFAFTSQVPMEDYISEYEFFIVLHPYYRRDSLIELLELDRREIVHRIESNGTLFCLIYR